MSTLALVRDVFHQETSAHRNPAMRARAHRRLVERLNLWLTIVGVVAFLMQPTALDRKSYRVEVPQLAHHIFNN